MIFSMRYHCSTLRSHFWSPAPSASIATTRSSRSGLILLAAFALLCVVVGNASATTTVPPPFDFINGVINYIRRAAVPTIVLALMFGALAWLFAKNGEGIVQWAGKAMVVLAFLLGAGTLLTTVGFQGATIW